MTSQTTFNKAAAPFIEGGRFPRSDLIPIVPPGPDTKLSPDSRLDASQLGKIPGRYNPQLGVWAGLGGHILAEGLPSQMQKRVGGWPTGNVGLRAAAWPAVDIDVESEAARDLVMREAELYLGNAPTRSRGNSPRTLLVYRAVGDEPIRKMRLLFEMDGKQHAVDVLGHGQQYLVAGIHPSGVSYEWREGHSLHVWGTDGLATVTAEDLRIFMANLADAILAAGGKVLARETHAIGSAGEGVSIQSLTPVAPTDTVLSAMKAIPNTPEEVPHRGDLVGIAAAVKSSLGKISEEIFVKEEFLTWATQHGWAEEDYAERIWNSVQYTRVSPDAIFRKARKYDWHGDAPLDFPGDDMQDVERIIDDAEDDQRRALQQVAGQLVYWPTEQKWIVLSTGEILSHQALNNHAIGMQVAPVGKTGLHAAAAKLRNSGMVRDVVGVTYAPGKPTIMEWVWQGKSGMWFNRWRPGMIIPDKGVTDEDVRVWLDHVAWLLPEKTERDVLLDWMAHLVQRPGVKVRWAPVIIGKQGVGKDTMLHPVIRAMGSHNVQEITPSALVDKWTFFYESQMVLVQEMLRLDKVRTYDIVKAAITGTGAGTVTVEQKYQPSYPIPNTTSFCFLTNHRDAISIAPDDRRFFVVECVPEEQREAQYYADLFKWYDTGGNSLIARWLTNRDISKFAHDSAPVWTEAKTDMLYDTLPEQTLWVMENFTRDNGLFAARSVIAASEIRDAFGRDLDVPPFLKSRGLTAQHIKLAMTVLGWAYASKQFRLPGSEERVRPWMRPDIKGAPSDVIRTRLIAERQQNPLGASDFNEGLQRAG